MLQHPMKAMAERSAEEALAEFSKVSLSVPQMILRAAVDYGSRAALVDAATKRTLSYRQLVTETRHAAKALAQRGLQKGDVVCLYSQNLPDYAVAVLAVTLAGGVVTLAKPGCYSETLVQQLKTTQAKVMLTTKRLFKTGLLAASQTAVRQVYSFDSTQGVQHFAELFETVIQQDEKPTDALLDVQRDLMAWWLTDDDASLRRTHAQVATALQSNGARADAVPCTVGFGSVSFADHEQAFLQLLQALSQGDTVVT
jgi:acyl-CoA synthetase (AMP-forming)/AMP-acid ligase II